jgi:hypothetical protein
MTSSSGLGVFETAAGLDVLIYATYAEGRQVFAVPGGYLDIASNFTVYEGETSATFSGGITRLELQTGLALNAPALWTMTGVPFSFSGSASLNGNIVSMSISIPGLGSMQATVDINTLELLSLTDNFAGTYGTFAEFLLRGGDHIMGSSGADILAGFAGNDTINGRGGNDIVNAGGGNDTLIWGNGDTFNGGAEIDTIKVANNVDVDLTAVAQNKLVNIEQFNLEAGNHTLTLNRSDVLDMSPTDRVKILGDAGDTIDIVGGFNEGATNNGFTTYGLGGGAKLVVDADILVM